MTSIRWLAGFLLCVLVATPALAFDGIRVTLLGTGGTQPSLERFGPAILVEAGEEILLFDCGRGATQRLSQAGVSLKSISAVFLTHLHAESTVGFPDLWLTGLSRGRTDPVVVFGPAGTVEMMRHFEQAYGADLASRENITREAIAIDARDIAENVVYQTANLTVTAFVVDHGIEPAYGFRIDYEGRRSVVISGDTRYSPNLARNARGVQLLVHEVAAADADLMQSSEQVRRVLALHSAPEDVARVLREAHPYLAIYSPVILLDATEDEVMRRTRGSYRGALQVGYDMMVIEIQNEVQVRKAPSEERAPHN